MHPAPSDLTPREVLSRAEELLNARRQVEIDQLTLLLAWADLHSTDPQTEPEAIPVRFGGPKLITPGGPGTPGVNDLAVLEIAVARHESVHATRRALADALDLRHRLPRTWVGAQRLRCEVWVVRKIAAMTRNLNADQAALVDLAIADALDQAPSRILAVAEAKIIEADTVAHAARIKANQRRKGVWFSRPRPGDQLGDPAQGVEDAAGLGTVFARIDEADALAHARMVEDLATALQAHAPDDAEDLTLDHWRAEAFAMLADPAAVLAFLNGITEPDTQSETSAAPETGATPSGTAELVIHVGLTETGALGPVARVEDLGPRLLAQVQRLLGRDAHVTVTPVIDLHTGRSVNGYEHPTDVRRRTELRTLGDVFPHASPLFSRRGRSPDHDHTVPYQRHGPPGQTGDHNDTPLVRHHHRAKTHLGYTVHQLGPDQWVWTTPHGLHRLVSGAGTTDITTGEYAALTKLLRGGPYAA